MSIDALVSRLQSDFALTPVAAAEVEFYLSGEGQPTPSFWEEITTAASHAGIKIFKIEDEKGLRQHEVALFPTTPQQTARDTLRLKSIITEAALAHGMRADFSAKPYADQPGSGLHIHVHLEDAQGKNVFYKDDDTISDPLKYSIGGLLAWLPDCMPVFAPHPESYARFAAGSNAPLTISWGANNRTVAIRLPDAAHDQKRIEHRVAGADADPEKVIAVILAAIHWGMKNKSEPGAQMYGDAAQSQYDLPKFPTSLEEALVRFHSSRLIQDI